MRFVVYADQSSGWRWSLKARNNRIIADSAEAYSSHRKAVQAAKRVKRGARRAAVVES